MRARRGPFWLRAHRGVICGGIEPWVKLSWFRLGGEIYLITLRGTWQGWPPRPIIIGGRLRRR